MLKYVTHKECAERNNRLITMKGIHTEVTNLKRPFKGKLGFLPARPPPMKL